MLHFCARPGETMTAVAARLGIPRSAIAQWKRRYFNEDECAEQIDNFLQQTDGE